MRLETDFGLICLAKVAIISGMATAYALGAPYPEDLEQDKFALLCFRCAASFSQRIFSERLDVRGLSADLERALSASCCCFSMASGTARAATAWPSELKPTEYHAVLLGRVPEDFVRNRDDSGTPSVALPLSNPAFRGLHRLSSYRRVPLRCRDRFYLTCSSE